MKKLLFVMLGIISFSVSANAQVDDESMKEAMKNLRTNERNRRLESKGYKVSFWEKAMEPETYSGNLQYTYSKYFPLGISLNYTASYLFIGAEGGFNFSKETYKISDTEYYDPKRYYTLAPGVTFKYFSLSCGLGVMQSKKSVIERTVSDYTEEITTTTKNSFKFMIRPDLKIYIPLDSDNEISLALNAGYDYTFKYKATNGIHFGIGIRWTNIGY